MPWDEKLERDRLTLPGTLNGRLRGEMECANY